MIKRIKNKGNIMKKTALFLSLTLVPSLSFAQTANTTAPTPVGIAPAPAVSTPAPATPSTQPDAAATTEQTENATAEDSSLAASVNSPSQSRINEALSKIPPEKARIFDNVMRKNQETNREKQQALRSLYTDIRNNFVGPSFNKEEFLAKSAQARELQSTLRTNLDKDLAEIASQLNQDERQIIFNALPARYTRE
jgi:uncharacterized membrane protein